MSYAIFRGRISWFWWWWARHRSIAALSTSLLTCILRWFCISAIVWMHQRKQGSFSGPYVMSNDAFFWLPTISVSGECFAPLHASHGCCKYSFRQHGAKHSHPGLELGCPAGWIKGGHQHCYRKVTFRRFSDITTIERDMATAASN